MLDHLLIVGRRHLERVLKDIIEHYHKARPHQGLGQRRPNEPAGVIPMTDGPRERRDRLGGLLHEYHRNELTRLGLAGHQAWPPSSSSIPSGWSLAPIPARTLNWLPADSLRFLWALLTPSSGW